MKRKRKITKDDIKFEKGSNENSYLLRSSPKPNLKMRVEGIKGSSTNILLKPHWWREIYSDIQIDIFDLIHKEFLDLDTTKEKIAEIINNRFEEEDNRVISYVNKANSRWREK